MWLTKNEKEVLKLLLSNGKLSDTSIAEKLDISTQATGRIRKRLEQDVIMRYSVELNKKELGANIIARMKIKFNNYTEKNIEKEENKMINNQNNIYVIKVMSGGGEYIIIAGFRDTEELKNVTENYKNDFDTHFTLREISIIPFSSLLKDSSSGLCDKMIDFTGIKHAETNGNDYNSKRI